MMHHAVGHAAEDSAHPLHAAIADDDDVGVHLFGLFDNDVVRVAPARVQDRFDAPLFRDEGEALEESIDAAIFSQMLELVGERFVEVRVSLDGAHDVQLALRYLSQAHGGLDRAARRP